MTIESWGYTGTITPNDVWAHWQQAAAARYMVASAAGCKVTPVTAGTYQLQVSAGWLGGQGILDRIPGTELVAVEPVTAGIGYSLIVARRDWAAPNPVTGRLGRTTIEALPASSNTLPAGMPARQTSPGVVDDQPLALVALAANADVPEVVYDLRALGGPELYNLDPALSGLPAWLDYLAQEGVTVRAGSHIYYRSFDSWQQSLVVGVPASVSANGATVAGWSRGGVSQRALDDGVSVDLYVELRQTTADRVAFDTQGRTSGGDRVIHHLPAPLFPWADQPTVGVEFRTPSGGALDCVARITRTGNVTIVSGPPGQSVRRSTTQTSNQWDVRFSAHYRRASR